MPRKTQAFTHLEGWDLERTPDIRLKAGAPTDADFYGIPRDGFMVWDTSSGVLWVRQGGLWSPVARPDSYAKSTLVTSLVSGSWTAVALAGEITGGDPYGLHDTGTNNTRFTIPAGWPTGWWRITGHGGFAGAAGGTLRGVGIGVGGAAPSASDFSRLDSAGGFTASTIQFTHVSVMRLAATDYVELQLFQNTGGAINSGNGPDWVHAEFLRADP